MFISQAFIWACCKNVLLWISAIQLNLYVVVSQQTIFYIFSQLGKSTGVTNKNQMIHLRKLQQAEAELKQQLSEKKGIMELRRK